MHESMLRAMERYSIRLAVMLIGLFAAQAWAGNAFIGAEACGVCHAKQFQLWQGSHHDLAMQPATPQTVLGNFENQTFKYFGVSSRFYRQGERYYVHTDGADGKAGDFLIKYTLGFYPLQQYLIEFPDGRIQALGLAWDSRDKSEGGQAWFHLYPKDNVKAGEAIHWTGIDQNWSHMCAECHTTNLHKNFDPNANRFNTTWSAMDVSCEACHGPGSDHADWARQPPGTRGSDDRLAIKLTESGRTRWRLMEGANIATPENAATTRPETDLCGRCHSRRSPLSEDYVWGKSLLDTHEPELLTAGKYFPDGRMQDEVYNYGSFLQSRMHQAGVTCNDCHEPHGLKLRAPGNGVCTQCHKASQYDTDRHHFHKAGSQGAQCSECHMPASTYMVVDRRHDHGFRIPRPDLTLELGIPNVCNDCHKDRKPDWAQKVITKHYGHAPQGHQDYAAILRDARLAAASAQTGLEHLALQSSAPGIARSTALWEMRSYLSGTTVKILVDALGNPDPIVRLGAAKTLSDAPVSVRHLLLKAVNDPIRAIRILAAKGLAAVPAESIPDDQRTSLKSAFDEYVAAQLLNGDRPESHMNLGIFYGESGNFEKAEAAYRMALKLSPAFAQAYVNLADLFRAQGRESEGEQLLREALKANPAQADLHHALGLLLVRTQRLREALPQLEKASEVGRANPHFAYVYAVALKGSGAVGKAVKLLEAIHGAHPDDAETILALAMYNRELGRIPVALGYAKRLVELRPHDGAATRLFAELNASNNTR